MTIKAPLSDIVEVRHLYAIGEIISQAPEWKPALDQISLLVRTIFIFDNLVVYLDDPKTHHLDIMYAKAVGRGRKAEADVAWGENLANRMSESHQMILEIPEVDQVKDRLQKPYMLGIPLLVSQRYLGCIIFIRFGGPEFSNENIELGSYIAHQIALLVERESLQREYELLQMQHARAQLQEDFVSTITHEIRNPLGFIKGYTTTLLRSDTTWDPKTQLEFLQIIDQETDHLQELIENLLDSARLQSGQLGMQFQHVRLDALVNDVILRANLHHPDLVIRTQVPKNLSSIRGNPRRLAQVFENIIGNSVKYAPGSEILITIKQEETGALIAIQDYGPGIPEKYLPYIFDRFFRNPEQPPNIRGSGLGLYICRQIIQAHKGTISAKSVLGQGTTFEIFLPARP